MTRVKSPRKTKKRTLLSATKGYKKPANNHFRIAHQRFLKAQVHAFRDRHNKKRIFRNLWMCDSFPILIYWMRTSVLSSLTGVILA